MVDELAGPLVTICVKDRECEGDTIQELRNETVLDATAMNEAADIVQEPNRYVLWEVLE